MHRGKKVNFSNAKHRESVSMNWNTTFAYWFVIQSKIGCLIDTPRIFLVKCPFSWDQVLWINSEYWRLFDRKSISILMINQQREIAFFTVVITSYFHLETSSTSRNKQESRGTHADLLVAEYDVPQINVKKTLFYKFAQVPIPKWVLIPAAILPFGVLPILLAIILSVNGCLPNRPSLLFLALRSMVGVHIFLSFHCTSQPCLTSDHRVGEWCDNANKRGIRLALEDYQQKSISLHTARASVSLWGQMLWRAWVDISGHPHTYPRTLEDFAWQKLNHGSSQVRLDICS